MSTNTGLTCSSHCAFRQYYSIIVSHVQQKSVSFQCTGIVSQGVTDFRILFSTYIVLGFVLMVITLMQSLGKASKASILVLMRQIILFVPLAIFLPKVGGLGIDGVFLAPAVTEKQIYETVWKQPGEKCEASVSSGISQLRKKLAPANSKDGYIRTVINSGYKFEWT